MLSTTHANKQHLIYIPKYVSATCLEHKKNSYKLPRKKIITNIKINKYKKKYNLKIQHEKLEVV